MEIKTIEDVIKIQKEFITKIQEAAETVRAGKAPVEISIGEKKELLEQTREKLEKVVALKEEIVRRYDEEIDHCRKIITRLEKEIQKVRKDYGQAAEIVKEGKEKKKRGQK
jgi:hypothetical protein